MAISGKPGLYKLVSQSRNGIIVESLETKKRIPAYASDKVSALEDIAIYSGDEEVHLKEVFKLIAEKYDHKQSITTKASNDEIKAVFAEILPEYDREKVYVSDMKKVFNWYNIIQEFVGLDFSEAEEKKEEETVASELEQVEEKEVK